MDSHPISIFASKSIFHARSSFVSNHTLAKHGQGDMHAYKLEMKEHAFLQPTLK